MNKLLGFALDRKFAVVPERRHLSDKKVPYWPTFGIEVPDHY